MRASALFGILLMAAIVLAVLYYAGRFILAAVRFQRKHSADSGAADARLRELAALSAAAKKDSDPGKASEPTSGEHDARPR